MFAAKLFQGLFSRSSSRRPARLGLQLLESRENPAGVVNVTFANNTITLTGDGNLAGNDVTISPTGDDTTGASQFLFTGNNGTQFRINNGAVQGDFDTSTLNGYVFPNSGSTNLIVNFGAGNDTFFYDGFTNLSGQISERAFGDITVNTGAGTDAVILHSVVGKNYLLNTGAGDDNVLMRTGTLFNGVTVYNGGATGGITVNGSTGNDTITLGVSTNKNVAITCADGNDNIFVSDNSRIGGSLLITGTSSPIAGTNSILVGTVGSTNIANDVIIKNGNHNINLTLGGQVTPLNVGRNLTVVSGSDITTGSQYKLSTVIAGGAISVTGGNGLDRLNNGTVISGGSTTFSMGNGGNPGDALGSLIVGANLTINYGSGNDTFGSLSVDVAGSITINAGGGNDTANISGIYSGGNFTYNGGEGGNGGANSPDTFTLNGVKGNATINSGSGLDAFTVNGLAHKNLTLSTGAGNDTVNLNQMLVLGNLSVNTALGDDTVSVPNMNVFGKTSFLTGGGSDTVTISGTSRYQQNVSLNLAGAGTDNDTLNINLTANGEELTMLNGLAIISGGGTDTFSAGNGLGLVMVHNGLKGDFIATDVVNTGSNLLQL